MVDSFFPRLLLADNGIGTKFVAHFKLEMRELELLYSAIPIEGLGRTVENGKQVSFFDEIAFLHTQLAQGRFHRKAELYRPRRQKNGISLQSRRRAILRD